MKTTGIMLCLLLSSVLILPASAQQPLSTSLSRKIDSLKEADQLPLKMTGDKTAAFQIAIHSNYPVIKAISEQHGFPGYNLVGKESSHNFWLVVQHLDFDVAFQKKVLASMKKRVKKKDASGQDFAYLTDRIILNEGGKQIYGTQVNMGFAGTKLKPCVDPVNLDKRRLAVGLTPIKDYLKQCDEVFQMLNKDAIEEQRKKADSLANTKH